MSDEARKNEFTHFDAEGRVRMVDVGGKPESHRTARAEAIVRVSPATLERIKKGEVEKGAVLSVARIAGIQGAKRTAELIPLCHPLALTRVEVDFSFEGPDRLHVLACAEVQARTGVEMEAMTACAVATLTIYDMCKARDRGIVIESLRLIEKTGGQSGDWRA